MMKVWEIPPKEVFANFLASEWLCKLQSDVQDQMCTVLDNNDQEEQ